MSMYLRGPGSSQDRVVGGYTLGQRIGSGSFAEVWKSRHRQHGFEVAVKEIDRKRLSSKGIENLQKEISILRAIQHPNIIKFFEAIETEDRILLVLEYCDGGDLAAYIQRHGKVSEEVARHFMRQLAAGLQVLQEKHLIHRDLKPQNLLLSTKGATLQLKIGDFGFARYLAPQGLADTLCGSPLYMAPEIIQNQKYDAQADLWSVGAILFQLVTGKPPFDGNNQYQLFQNILRSGELHFPEGALEELHLDCVDLCRSLLRRNPADRLTFGEFFNHKFLGESRKKMDLELDSSLLQSKSMVDALGAMPLIVCDNKGKSVDNQCSSDHTRADSLEPIEKDYVLVDRSHFASMETFSDYSEISFEHYSTSTLLKCQAKKSDQESAVSVETKETGGVSDPQAKKSSAVSTKIPQFQVSDPQATSSESAMLREVQKLSILHPSTRLQFLHQYAEAIAELAKEKYDAGLYLESFAVELVVLAIWKKALQIYRSWMTSVAENKLPGSSSANEPTNVKGTADLSPNSEYNVDLSRPSFSYSWAEQGFIIANDRAKKLSCHVEDMDATAKMPDAMEIIYQKALTIGRIGAEAEDMENKGSAAASNSKAILLLSFIVGEAVNLPLNPPFSLTPANQKRIQTYINDLQNHKS